LKFNAHINVEYCASIKSIGYLFKYIHKGFDCQGTKTITGTQGAHGTQEQGAQATQEQGAQGTQEQGAQGAKKQGTGSAIKWDEIAQYRDNRYVSAPEAFWRLSKFPLAYKSHTIQRLAVHLPQEELVFFTPGLDKAASKKTTLTAWFILNLTTPAARDMFYREIPLHYVFDGTWKPRKRQTNLLSRIYSVSIRQI
jgi:hypothetical protein